MSLGIKMYYFSFIGGGPMKKLWEVTIRMDDNSNSVIRLFASNPISLIQQLSRKHAHLLVRSRSIEWGEVLW
jgi:hypothetical protein